MASGRVGRSGSPVWRRAGMWWRSGWRRWCVRVCSGARGWGEVAGEVEEHGGGLARGVVDPPAEAGVFVLVRCVGGDREQAGGGGGFDLGCDGAGADGGELLEGFDVALGLLGLGPGEELVEGELSEEERARLPSGLMERVRRNLKRMLLEGEQGEGIEFDDGYIEQMKRELLDRQGGASGAA